MDIYYAFLKNNIVENIFVFDELASSEMLEEFKTLHNADELVVIPDYFDNNVTVGAEWTGTKFIPVSPFPSWTWNDEENKWVAPLPRPKGIAIWNEETQQWDIIPKP
jgi:hypothetical protein